RSPARPCTRRFARGRAARRADAKCGRNTSPDAWLVEDFQRHRSPAGVHSEWLAGPRDHIRLDGDEARERRIDRALLRRELEVQLAVPLLRFAQLAIERAQPLVGRGHPEAYEALVAARLDQRARQKLVGGRMRRLEQFGGVAGGGERAQLRSARLELLEHA